MLREKKASGVCITFHGTTRMLASLPREKKTFASVVPTTPTTENSVVALVDMRYFDIALTATAAGLREKHAVAVVQLYIICEIVLITYCNVLITTTSRRLKCSENVKCIIRY